MRTLTFCLAFLWCATASAADVIHHELSVTLDPATHHIQVQDTITLPRMLSHGKTLRFRLHTGLQPRLSGEHVSMERGASAPDGDIAEEFVLTMLPGAQKFVLNYAGEIYHPLQARNDDYARGDAGSAGIIDTQGVFLAGGTYWYPVFGDELLNFTLEVRVPSTWSAISQGARTQNDSDTTQHRALWEETQPQDEIYLLAAPYHEYAGAPGAVQSLVFLRDDDPSLAQKYLAATQQYVGMYSQLLGPYPYAKFALVENFWETGFGMPSFTLLGSRVIRLPFIVTSSYPHEILHNWWGNGVYVAYEKGNWSEGLTSYLADHLLAEQRGEGVQYRRSTLQKYTDFVSAGRDFPLTEFRSRHSSATEAVGYGKTLMLFHMLRSELGDAAFVQALREFYERFRFRVADFNDLKQTFVSSTQRNLDPQFDPWVTRTGAPLLRVQGVRAAQDGAEFTLTARITQTQDGAAFPLSLPIAITLQGQAQAFQTRVMMRDKSLDVALRLPARPLHLDVDPEFDVFRRLDRSEIAPALSGLFGASQVTIVLPTAAPAPLRSAYEQLALTWQRAEPAGIRVVKDNALKALPKDRSVWIFGWENRWRTAAAQAVRAYDVAFSETGVRINAETFDRNRHALALSARHPQDAQRDVAWLAVPDAATLAAVARKLPHYARYSYVGFEGEAANNVLKGQWPVLTSPLSVSVQQADGTPVVESPRVLAPRHALIEWPR